MKADVDLLAGGSAGNALHGETPQRKIVLHAAVLALKDLDVDLRLVGHDGRHPLDPADRNRGIAVDDRQEVAGAALGAQFSGDLHAQGKGGHVGDDHVVDRLVAGDEPGLHGRAQGHDLVRVEAVLRLLAELGHQALDDGRHARGAADEEHLVDVVDFQAGVAQGAADRQVDPLQDVLGPGLELLAADHGLGRAGREVAVDVGHADGRLGLRREAALGHLALLDEPRDQQRMLQLGPFEDVALRLQHAGRHGRGEILAAQERVAGRGPHFHRAFEEFHDRHVERAAAQVEDQQDLFLFQFVKAVGDGGRRRLVDDALDLQAGDLPGVDRRLPLVLVEVGRHGDDGLRHRLAQDGPRRLA